MVLTVAPSMYVAVAMMLALVRLLHWVIDPTNDCRMTVLQA